MSLPKSPFAASSSSPGLGSIVLSLLPPGKQVLTSFTYQYPLKLIAPDPHFSPGNNHVSVVFLLTYGGGLVGGDRISLSISLEECSHLVLVTQGSTKIFKSPTRDVVSGQFLNVKVAKGAALCYLPDPTQPFAESVYEQRQTFLVDPSGKSSLCVLDWVSEGRTARGESWHLWSWKGRNEVRELLDGSDKPGKLLLRDAVMLGHDDLGSGLGEKTNGMGVFGTLILFGPVFAPLGEFFLQEFNGQPKIGNKSWKAEKDKSDTEREGELKQQFEKSEGLLWTAASVRGFVLVKFGSREIDGARRWLGNMIRREGSIEREFGHQALISLR